MSATPNHFVRRPRATVRVFAVLVAVAASAWLHDAIAFTVVAAGLIHRVADPEIEPLQKIALETIEPPKDMPKYVVPAPERVATDEAKPAVGALKLASKKRQKKIEKELEAYGVLALLSSDGDENGISSVFGKGDLGEAGGVEGGVAGALVGDAPGDTIGIGGLGLSGVGDGGGDLRVGGGGGGHGEAVALAERRSDWSSRVGERLRAHWHVPATDPGDGAERVRLLLRLDASGRLVSVSVVGSAGATWDDSALAAARAASPFPPPPADMLRSGQATLVVNLQAD